MITKDLNLVKMSSILKQSKYFKLMISAEISFGNNANSVAFQRKHSEIFNYKLERFPQFQRLFEVMLIKFSFAKLNVFNYAIAKISTLLSPEIKSPTVFFAIKNVVDFEFKSTSTTPFVISFKGLGRRLGNKVYNIP